jgi:multicomponent Na+:H+ antiporter subunit G
MMSVLVITVTVTLLSVGLFFFFSATVGFLRFPDVYTRMHAVLCVAGLALYNLFDNFCWYGFVQSAKLISIAVFWFLASPTATHALLRSAFESGVIPWTKDGTVIIDKTETEVRQ